MTADNGLFIATDERICGPASRVFGGRDAKVIRRRDGRIGVNDAHTGMPIGLVISEEEAATLPLMDDDGLGAMRAISLAAFIGLAIAAYGYAAYHVGRLHQRHLDDTSSDR